MSVLGSCILDERAIDKIVDMLKPDMFYRMSHQIIFRKMVEMRLTGIPIDIVTLKDELGDELNQVGGLSYLMSLGDFTPTTANVKSHADIVYEKHKRRLVMNSSYRTMQDSTDDSLDIDDVIKETLETIISINEDKKSAETKVSSIVPDAIASMLTDGDYLKTGVYDLDAVLNGGIPNAQFTLVGARTGVGKTSFVSQLITQSLTNNNTKDGKVIVFTTEDKIGLIKRLITHKMGVPHAVIRSRINSGDKQAQDILSKASREVAAWNLMVVDDSCVRRMDIETITSIVTSEVAMGKVSLVIVDFIQDVPVSHHMITQKRYQQIAHIGAGLRSLTTKFKLRVVATAQIGREAEEKKPRLSHLRESGDLEQFTWNVILMYIEGEREQWGDEVPIELIVAKHREGETGVVRASFNRTTSRFGSIRSNKLNI